MKKWIVIIAGLAVVAGIATWVWNAHRTPTVAGRAYQVGPKGNTLLSRAQSERIRGQIQAIPGAGRSQMPASPSAAVNETLKTLNDVQRINQMNKEQNR